MTTASRPATKRTDLHRKALEDDRRIFRLYAPGGHRSKHRYYGVPSRSEPEAMHVVTVAKQDLGSYQFRCSPKCQAYRWLGQCSHTTLVERLYIAWGRLEDPLEMSDE